MAFGGRYPENPHEFQEFFGSPISGPINPVVNLHTSHAIPCRTAAFRFFPVFFSEIPALPNLGVLF